MKSNWKRVKVTDVCLLIVDCVNKTAPHVDYETPYKMIRTPFIKKGRVSRDNCRYVTEETFLKWTRRAHVLKGDILLTREAPIGEIGYVDFDDSIFLGQRIMQYRPNPEVIEPRFFLYSFLSSDLKHQFGVHEGTGTTVSHIRVPDCSNFELNLPQLNVQKAIVELLGSLDEQIENNKAMNQTLEKITQRLFKSWFVDFDTVKANRESLPFDGVSPEVQGLFPNEFEESELGMIPKGWEVQPFSNIAKLETTSAKPNKEPEKKWIHYSIPAFDENQFPTIDLGETIKSNKYQMFENTILVSKLNPRFKRIWFPKIKQGDYRSVCSTEFMQFLPLNLDWFAYALSYVISDRFQSEMLKTVSGTTGSRQRAQPKEVSKMPALIPTPEVLNAFARTALPLIERHQDNLNQINTLKRLRDRLLPKLISGQISADEAKQELAEAV